MPPFTPTSDAFSRKNEEEERDDFDVPRGWKFLASFFQGYLVAGRECDSWWEGQRGDVTAQP